MGLAVGATIGYLLAPRAQDGQALNIAASSPASKPAPAPAAVAKAIDPIPADFDNLTEADLHTQIAELAKRPQNKVNKDLLTRALQAWTRKDPHAAWQWALAQPKDHFQRSRYAIIGEWVKTQPKAAVSAAQSLTLDQGRDEVLRHALQQWASSDLPSALQAIKAQAGVLPNTEAIAAGIILNLGLRDPLQALHSISLIDDPETRVSVTASIIAAWVKTDPNKALSAARSLQDEKMRRRSLLDAYANWIQKDLKSGITAIENDPEPSVRQAALKNAMIAWFLKEPFAAANYVTLRGDPTLIPGTSGQSFADKATPQEVERLLTLLPESKEKDDFTRNIAKTEIRRGNYPRAVNLLNKTADSILRDAQINSLGHTWSKERPQTLEPWLRQQPESPDRDLVTLGMVTQLARDNPRAALRWLSFITDPTARLAATKNVAHHWLKLEPGAGQVWITQGSGLPPTHQSKVLENSSKPYVDYTYDDHLSTRWPLK